MGAGGRGKEFGKNVSHVLFELRLISPISFEMLKNSLHYPVSKDWQDFEGGERPEGVIGDVRDEVVVQVEEAQVLQGEHPRRVDRLEKVVVKVEDP